LSRQCRGHHGRYWDRLSVSVRAQGNTLFACACSMCECGATFRRFIPCT
jgi:hypothetical protein